jgi:uncharacterized protein YbjQ (UPF0145 family)
MNKYIFLNFGLTLILLTGCATPLLEGANVQIITAREAKEFECERIGFLNSFDTFSLTTSGERRNAMAEIRNSAAAAGANAVVIANQSTTPIGTQINGYAWDCEALD